MPTERASSSSPTESTRTGPAGVGTRSRTKGATMQLLKIAIGVRVSVALLAVRPPASPARNDGYGPRRPRPLRRQALEEDRLARRYPRDGRERDHATDEDRGWTRPRARRERDGDRVRQRIDREDPGRHLP